MASCAMFENVGEFIGCAQHEGMEGKMRKVSRFSGAGMSAILSGTFALFAVTHAEADTLELMHFWNSNSEKDALAVISDVYTDRATAWVEDISPSFNDLRDQVLLRLSEGYPPSAFLWNAAAWGQFYDAGTLAVLSDFMSAEELATIQPSLRSFISQSSDVVALPVTAHGMNWTYYNASIMSDNGFDAPADWDMFFAQMAVIEKNGDATIASGGGMWEHQIAFDSIILSHGGRDMLRATRTGLIDETLKPTLQEALGDVVRYIQLWQRSGLDATSWDEASRAVASGAATVQVMGDWAKGEMVSKGYTPGEDFWCEMAPHTADRYLVGVDVFLFPSTNDEDVKNAQTELAQIVLSPDVQAEFSRIKGALPVVDNIDVGVLDICGQKGFAAVQEQGFFTVQDTGAFTDGIVAANARMIQQVIDGGISSSDQAIDMLLAEYAIVLSQ